MSKLAIVLCLISFAFCAKQASDYVKTNIIKPITNKM